MPVGIPSKIPSTLSKTPPCPGKIFPVSFNFAFRFKYEKNKSPNWQPIEVKIEIIKKKYEKLFDKKNIKEEMVTHVKNIEPIAPEKVLFGLILVKRGPFIILPTTKPPTSDAIQPNNKMKRIYFNWI